MSMGRLAPSTDTQPPLDPKRQRDAYLQLRGRLYRVLGDTPHSTLLAVENVSTLHDSHLALLDVAAAELVRAAPLSDLEVAFAASPSIPDPEPVQGD